MCRIIRRKKYRMTSKSYQEWGWTGLPVLLPLLMAGCALRSQPSADPDLLVEIQGIRAIDNHAHPVRAVAAGEQPDRGFDALPVDNMEPQSDPVNLRPGAPAMRDAGQALFGVKPKA